MDIEPNLQCRKLQQMLRYNNAIKCLELQSVGRVGHSERCSLNK